MVSDVFPWPPQVRTYMRTPSKRKYKISKGKSMIGSLDLLAWKGSYDFPCSLYEDLYSLLFPQGSPTTTSLIVKERAHSHLAALETLY